MDVVKLDEQYVYREENMKIENSNRMKDLLKYFYVLSKRNKIKYELKDDLWETFVANYHNLCEQGLEKEIQLYMRGNGAKKEAFLYEYLHVLINTSNEIYKNSEPIKEFFIEIDHTKYLFAKADQYLKNTAAEHILKRKLEKECFDRTQDLVSVIKDSEAVVSYLPNLFTGGYYHAYLKCKNGVLIDPATNLVMLNEEAKQLLKGDIVFSWNQEQLIQQLKQLETVDKIELYDCPKLLQLALFKECYETESLENKNHRRR